MLEKLKALNLDRLLDTDEAVSLSAYGRTLVAEYENLDLQVPDWVTKSVETLRAEIERRTHAADIAEMKRIEAEIDSYKSANERRTEAQKRLASLQSKLGLTKGQRK